MAGYTFRDVLWAVNVMNKYSSIKEALDSIVKQLATKGVKVSDYDLQNPSSLLPIFIEAKKMGVDVDLTELERAFAEAGDLSFDDIEKALEILSEYNYLNDEVDRTFRNLIDNTGMSVSQLGLLANFFGLNLGLPTSMGGSSQQVEELIDPSDYDEIKSFIKKIKKAKT